MGNRIRRKSPLSSLDLICRIKSKCNILCNKSKLYLRETDKRLLGVFTQLIFLEYPIVFETNGNKNHKN